MTNDQPPPTKKKRKAPGDLAADAPDISGMAVATGRRIHRSPSRKHYWQGKKHYVITPYNSPVPLEVLEGYPEFMSLTDMVKRFGFHRNTVSLALKRGEFPFVRYKLWAFVAREDAYMWARAKSTAKERETGYVVDRQTDPIKERLRLIAWLGDDPIRHPKHRFMTDGRIKAQQQKIREGFYKNKTLPTMPEDDTWYL